MRPPRAVLALASIATARPAPAGSAPAAVLEELGDLEGEELPGGIAAFLDVPYAAPPVGPLRWRPPRPPSPWEATRANPRALSRCPQPSEERRTYHGHPTRDTEDCLVLNVFVQRWRLPSEQCTGADVVGTCGRGEQANAEALAPVLVYIHGGSGMHGAAHNPGASGADLAESQDLVCIDVNYRLGILGFLAHPELSAEDAEAAQAGDPWGGSGSYALLDQVAALEWVQQHAASFGGDPDRVTIWGLSSGAQYVSALLAFPFAGDLFHRAFVQSCVDLANVRRLTAGSDAWLGLSAEEWGEELGARLGAPRGRGQLRAMRSAPLRDLVRLSGDEAAMGCYEPAIDGRWRAGGPEGEVHGAKAASLLEALPAGNFSRVPVVLGYTEHDGFGAGDLEQTMYPATAVNDRPGLERLFAAEFGSARDEALSHYLPAATDGRPRSRGEEAAAVAEALDRFGRDVWYFAATWHMAELLVRAPSPPPVFVYVFAAAAGRSPHGSDRGAWRKGPSMSAYLGNFARHGDPNGAGLPAWPAKSPGSALYLEVGSGPKAKALSERDRRRHRLLGCHYFSGRVLAEVQRGEPAAGRPPLGYACGWPEA